MNLLSAATNSSLIASIEPNTSAVKMAALAYSGNSFVKRRHAKNQNEYHQAGLTTAKRMLASEVYKIYVQGEHGIGSGLSTNHANDEIL